MQRQASRRKPPEKESLVTGSYLSDQESGLVSTRAPCGAKRTHAARCLRTAAARKRLDGVKIADETLELMSRLCMTMGADGLRGELTLMRAARAAAALDGAKSVTASHIRQVAPMVLRHRLRRNPLDEGGSTVRVERGLAEVLGA